MKFRKRPVVIEATQLTQPSKVLTLEGEMRGNVGDWLITGVEGEQYFCKNEIFIKTYEEVEGNIEKNKRILETTGLAICDHCGQYQRMCKC